MKHCAPHRTQHFHEERARLNNCHYTTRWEVQWRCEILPLFLPMGILPFAEYGHVVQKQRLYLIKKKS